ncbi:uncharacterized protein LOC126990538, partial [Eriocheir sinensis]|uniref:uncharacterized protein LOC126990538 n=1 Tax=Eriocheir sinensis TaxID=95602 RepID=UPI0021CADDC0
MFFFITTLFVLIRITAATIIMAVIVILLVTKKDGARPVLPHSPNPSPLVIKEDGARPVLPHSPNPPPLVIKKDGARPVLPHSPNLPPLVIKEDGARPVLPHSPNPPPLVIKKDGAMPVLPHSPNPPPLVIKKDGARPVLPHSPNPPPLVIKEDGARPVLPHSPNPPPLVIKKDGARPVLPHSPNPPPLVIKKDGARPVLPHSPNPSPLVIKEDGARPVLPHSTNPPPLVTSAPRDASICDCSNIPWPESNDTVAFLNLSLPWFNTSTVQEVRSRHPNLPIELLHDAEQSRCSLLPTIFSIEWRNRHWQLATLGSTKFYLYSAFFDPETDVQTSIRLLGVCRSTLPADAWCHVWFGAAAPPHLVKVTDKDYLDYQERSNDRQMPFLLRCPLPPNTTAVPLAVSLTAEPCGEATNLLKVIGGKKREVSAYRNKKVPDDPRTLVKGWVPAVCGPALYYYHEDFSVRLVEWLELLRALGFGQVFLHVTDVHP